MVTQTDLNCAKCGYNLRGLRQDGVCPECGTSVLWTLARLRPKLRSRFFYTKWLCLIFFGVHVLLIVLALPVGEVGVWLLMLLDSPLLLIPHFFGVAVVDVLIFIVLTGPVLYAGIGALLGLLIDVSRRRLRAPK